MRGVLVSRTSPGATLHKKRSCVITLGMCVLQQAFLCDHLGSICACVFGRQQLSRGLHNLFLRCHVSYVSVWNLFSGKCIKEHRVCEGAIASITVAAQVQYSVNCAC